MTKTQDIADAVLRHQVYLEGLKAGAFLVSLEYIERAQAEIVALCNAISADTLGDMTIGQFRALTALVAEVAGREYSALFDWFLDFLLDYLEKDREALPTEVQDNGAVAIVPLATLALARSIMTEALDAIVPADGTTLANMLAGVRARAISEITRTLARARTDNMSKSGLLRELVGTREADFRDGLFARLRRDTDAATATAIQFIASDIRDRVFGLFTDLYQWISVIDNATTPVCRSRDGNVYRRGAGPIPPAHWRCRSSTAPVFGNERVADETYWSWLRRQPEPFLRDAFGAEAASDIVNGRADANRYDRFRDPRPLTPAQFAARTSLITKGTA